MQSRARAFALLSMLCLVGGSAACSSAAGDDALETAPPSALTENAAPAPSPRALFESSVWSGVKEECVFCHAPARGPGPALVNVDSVDFSYFVLQRTAVESYWPRSLAKKLELDLSEPGAYRPGCGFGAQFPHRASPALSCAIRTWVLAEQAAAPTPAPTE